MMVALRAPGWEMRFVDPPARLASDPDLSLETSISMFHVPADVQCGYARVVLDAANLTAHEDLSFVR